jgi:cytoskeletal protein RodZ
MRECGNTLKAHRLALGLSREEAYRNFRVPLTFIAAIEDGHVEGLPPPIYSRGFIKTYCESLGVPPHPLLDAYEDQLNRPLGAFSRLSIARRANRPAWFDDALMWAAIAGVVIVSWVSYSLLVRPGGSRADTSVQAQTVELPVNDPFAAP